MEWKQLVEILEKRGQNLDLITREDRVQEAHQNHRMEASLEGLMINLFPYHLENGIFHYLYWSSEWKFDLCQVKALFPQVEIYCFINPDSRRSRPQNPHFHIFVRAGANIPKLQHTFGQFWCYRKQKRSSKSSTRYHGYIEVEWNRQTISKLWQHKFFQRWKDSLTTLPQKEQQILLILSPLLLYGGSIGVCPPDASIRDHRLLLSTFKISSSTNRGQDLEVPALRTVPHSPYLHDYFDYICYKGEYHNLQYRDPSFEAFNSKIKPWYRETAKIEQ